MSVRIYKNKTTVDYSDVSAMFVENDGVHIIFKSGAIFVASGYEYLATEFQKYKALEEDKAEISPVKHSN